MNSDEINPKVQTWLRDVDKIIAEKDAQFGDETSSSTDLLSRYRLSKRAKEMSLEVDGLIQDGNFSTVTLEALPPGVDEAGTSSAVSDQLAFDSRTLIIEGIMDALKDDETNPIVICGMGGIGKTTMLKEIEKKAKAESLFKEFVWADVTQTPDVSKIQEDIAEYIGLNKKLSIYRSLRIRKAELYRRLSLPGKKSLVILDDVWVDSHLEEIGLIPFPESCKILISSRNQDIYGFMPTRKNFVVDELKDDESWRLFKKTAGNSIESPELRPIAKKVLSQCGNLPILISTVGSALCNKNEKIWSDALRQLKVASPQNIPGVIKQVYRPIELSYRCLESQEAESCFLLCSLYPEGSNIKLEDLVKHGLGLGLFKKIESIVEGRNHVEALIDRLKSCFLLLDCKKQGCVKMHDVVRGVALFIASDQNLKKKNTSRGENEFVVTHGVELEGWPRIKGSRSQQYTSSAIITNGTSFQDAELVLLSCTNVTVEPQKTTLSGMEKLKVLDVRTTNMLLIMPSLPMCKNLQTLCLEYCQLGDVSMIGKLQKLMILSLRGSHIKELPLSFRSLSNLWFLDLTECGSLEVYSSGILSSLAKLQELYVRKSFLDAHGSGHLVFQELLSLSNLTILEADQPLVINLKDYLREDYKLFHTLQRFHISIQVLYDRFTDSYWNRGVIPSENIFDERCFLALNFDSSSNWNSLQQGSIGLLLEKTDFLELRMNNLREALNVLDGGCLLRRLKSFGLKSLGLDSCHALEYVIDMTRSFEDDDLFPLLLFITINDSNGLRRICNGELPIGSFKELRLVRVSLCGSLNSLFPLSVDGDLNQLEEVDIQRCQKLEEIVSFEGEAQDEEDVTHELMLPSLTHLNLEDLPEFVGISKNVQWIFSFPLLFIVKLRKLPKLITLHHPNNSAPESSSKATGQHLFDAKDGSFLELRYVTVSHCDSILSIFSSNSMQNLQNLENLTITFCGALKTLFDFEGVDGEPNQHVSSTLSCVEVMELDFLPTLEYIWKPTPKIKAFQNLIALTISYCWKLNYVFPVYIAEGLVKLELLEIGSCYSMVEIFGGNEDIGNQEDESESNKIVFAQVKNLYLYELSSLVRVCATSRIVEWSSLTKVEFRDIGETTIFFNEKDNFPNLERLKFSGMPKMRKIWSNQLLVTNSFRELRILVLESCPRLLVVVPSYMQDRLQKLEELELNVCESVEEIFEFAGLNHVDEEEAVTISETEENPSTSQLERRDISRIDCKQTPVFQTLTKLKVHYCNNLKILLSYSAARALVHLQSLSVWHCNMIEEIISEPAGGEKESNGILSHLLKLELYLLPNLMSFYKGHCNFDWPNLTEFVFQGCPKVQTFCFGSVCTPKLKGVKSTFSADPDDSIFWEGDLKSTVEHFVNRSNQ